ncbi:MAG TPA: hypothetical protein VGK09_08355 [Rhodocyclaceae bacterium]|jgi:hypothetical protein
MAIGTLELKVEVKIHFAWWVTPYLWLTAFGARISLPLNPEVVVSDIKRGMKLEIKVRQK